MLLVILKLIQKEFNPFTARQTTQLVVVSLIIHYIIYIH